MEPIYQKLSTQIESYIQKNGLQGRLPGMLRLSKELGVHHVTLGKALRLLEQKGVVAIRGTAGTFVVNRQPAPRPRHHVIAVVGLNQVNDGNRQLLTHLNALARPAGYSVIGIAFETDLFRQNQRILLNFPVDGFIFLVSCLLKEQLDIIRNENIPVVSCGRQDSYPWLDQIKSDHDRGYDLLLQRLLALGHRRIAFVEFDREPEGQYYLNLIRRAFERNLGADFAPELFYIRAKAYELWQEYGEKYWEVYARQAVDYFCQVAEPPSAIVTVGGNLIQQFYGVLRGKGFNIPQDISLVGVWGAIPEEFHNLEFSGIYFNEIQMLDHALQRMLHILTQGASVPQELWQAPEFKYGSTMGGCRKNIAIPNSKRKD